MRHPRLASLVCQKFQRFKKLKELRKYASSIALGEFFTPGSSWFFGNKFLHLNFVFEIKVSDNQNIACLGFQFVGANKYDAMEKFQILS